VEIAVVDSVTKTIGSLALAYPYLRRLGVANIIDTLTTRGKEREVPTGRVIEILVLNRLAVRPTPISKVRQWAKDHAVEEVYGIAAEALNDDRIGRALDEIHPHLVDAWTAIVLGGTQAYGVRLDQVHSDVTRIAFEGSYDLPPLPAGENVAGPRITYGFTGKEDPTRKQLTVSLSVAADGALPAWYRVADGNAADCRAYPAHSPRGHPAVREHLHLDQPLMIGDSKLVSRNNMLAFCRVQARFVGPAGLTAGDRAVLQAQWEAGVPMTCLDPAQQEEEPRAGRYWSLEVSETLSDPEHKTSYTLRRLFVQSIDDRRAARHQRAKDLWRARRALRTIRGRLSRPAYRDRSLVERKVAQAMAKVTRYLQVEVTEGPEGLALTWHLDREQLHEDEGFDGLYCLLTNQAAAEASSQQVFWDYKGQSKVEGRFRSVKHPPLQIRPLWLHQPKRIESLLFVVMVALFLFALIEREARRVVQETGQVFTGLRPEGRDQLPVTAERLLEVFGSLNLVKQRLRVGGESVELITPTTLSSIQAQILDRLKLMTPDAYLQPTVTPYPL
jgi:transposase